MLIKSSNAEGAICTIFNKMAAASSKAFPLPRPASALSSLVCNNNNNKTTRSGCKLFKRRRNALINISEIFQLQWGCRQGGGHILGNFLLENGLHKRQCHWCAITCNCLQQTSRSFQTISVATRFKKYLLKIVYCCGSTHLVPDPLYDLRPAYFCSGEVFHEVVDGNTAGACNPRPQVHKRNANVVSQACLLPE